MTGTSTATLLLVATIIGGHEGILEVDAGLANGLRVGDLGQVYYELKVGTEARRVEVGEARVVGVDDFSAVVEHEGEREARTGYRVRFELPGGRISPSEMIRLAADRLDEEQFDEVVRRLLEERDKTRKMASMRLAVAPSKAVPAKATVPAGIFPIGLPREQATFFNQQPRFEVRLEEFMIDLRPVSQTDFHAFAADYEFERPAPDTPELPAAPATSIPFVLSQEYCRDHGGRLPTEFEWEVALREVGVVTVEGVLEWTSSWLQAYPDNTRPEADYGERFKVLRGASSPDDPDQHLRRFLDPSKSHASVGFRCAYSIDGGPE